MFATDSTGAKVWEVSYLPFGGVHVSTGANIDLRFPGQWFQSESGLYQNWMRDYDPTTGRYMQADPLGLVDGASVYGYARQNPGRYTDPRGECVGPWAIACAGAAAGAFNVVVGFYIDKYFGDDCYTFDELLYDFTLGFAFGGFGKAWGLAGGAGWRAGAAGGAASKAGRAGTKYGTTPKGRPLTRHYATETGPVRNIPGSVVDHAIDTTKGVSAKGGKTVHYDPINNVTVVTGDSGSIISARKGIPRRGQY